MQIFVGFAPWIAFMILSGNNTFELGAVVALVIAVATFVVGRARGAAPTAFDVKTLAFFALLVVAGLLLDESVIGRWVQPVSNLALFSIALISILVGRPFTRQYAQQTTPPESWRHPAFLAGTLRVAWAWTAAFGVMFVSSLITLFVPSLETWTTWVIPISALVAAVLYTRSSQAQGERARDAASAQPDQVS